MIIDELIEKWKKEEEELQNEGCIGKAGMADVFVNDLQKLKEQQQQDITFDAEKIEKDVAIRVLAEMVAEK